ncbi:hypothetical protein [Prosthecobacter debontii]|uniref:hypothetical protein n=1 Tax=Prosthecobacter debontii TaxID=48467 RepID=UPI0015911DC9|nr:hypothetical protein [Prosthecobacter debontii]
MIFRGRSYLLFKRGDENSPWWVRVQKNGKRVAQSCDTSDLKLAKDRAKLRIAEVLDGRPDRAATKSRKGVPTIQEIIEFGKASHLAVREKTQNSYSNAVLLLLQTVYGYDKEKAEKQRLDVLTAELARSYQAKMQGLKRAETKRLTSGNTTANSQLRFARSLFSKQRLLDYKEAGFVMPEALEGFLNVPYLEEESHRYSDKPIPQKAIKEMDQALPALKLKDVRLWAIHLMVRLMGLRDSEIDRAQDHWLSETKEGGMEMRIIKREGEAMPKRSEGVVAVPPELAAYFKKRKGYLIPAKSKTERYDLIYRDHNEWLRQFIPDRVKAAHELRKHFGAVWATKTGSLYEAAQRLRVTLIVAEYHYSAMLKKPEALTLDDYQGMVS